MHQRLIYWFGQHQQHLYLRQSNRPHSKHPCAALPLSSDHRFACRRLPDDDVSSPLHPLVRTMADDFHGPRAEDLDQLHQLQKSTKRPAKGDQMCLHHVVRPTQASLGVLACRGCL
jgi:hypothetical protein